MSKIIPIEYRKLIKIFELEGFRVTRQKGDHIESKYHIVFYVFFCSCRDKCLYKSLQERDRFHSTAS